VHLCEDIGGKGLGNLEKVSSTTDALNASFLSLSELSDMAIGGVLENQDVRYIENRYV
jgi:hypothetical protein